MSTPVLHSEHKAQIVRVSDNIKNIAKELGENGTSLSADSLKVVAAKLNAAAAELSLVHSPGPVSAPEVDEYNTPLNPSSGGVTPNTPPQVQKAATGHTAPSTPQKK